MHRLFWKIFLSFWISLILFAAASMLTASLYLEHIRTQQADSPRDRYRSYLDDARLVAESEGIEGLINWSKALDRSEAIPHLLIDSAGNDLLGRQMSPHLAARLQRAMHPARQREQRMSHRRRGVIELSTGEIYRLVPDFQAVSLGRVLRRPRVIAIPVLVATVISGLVCFLLARYLTVPIRRLSRATRQFAEGDLDRRVAPSMGRRRDEIADLSRDFDQMAERLQRLIESQKQLLSDVSHELRSPLARLQVALGLTRQREAYRDNPELDRIERETEHLNELISQLLSLARLDTNEILDHTTQVNLDDLLAAIAGDAEFEAAARNRHVRLVDTTPVAIEANEVLLNSAFENVVRNAVRYTQEGTSVEISLLRDPVAAGWLKICVRDHGPGVPEEKLTKLFEPFVRVSEARDRESGGYGLGLAIAERAIRLHGGKITAANASSGGLVVTIHLPDTKAA